MIWGRSLCFRRRAICAESENIFGGAYNRPDERRFSANDPRPELKPLLRKWDGNPVVNRATDSPHIKSYLRYREAPEGDGQCCYDRKMAFCIPCIYSCCSCCCNDLSARQIGTK